MAQAPRARQAKAQIYEVQLESGETYQITAYSDEQAARIGDFIKQQAASGNPQLKDVRLPDNAIVQEAEVPQTSATGAAARGLVRGGTVNFGDEISAFANAAGLAPLDNLTGIAGEQQAFWDNPEGFWAAFNNNMEQQKRLYAADDVQHPTASGVGQVVGGLTTAARLPMFRTGTSVPAAVGRGAAEGAVFGGVGGFGAGDTLENRGKSAATAALAGGALGGTLSGTITGLAPAVARYGRVLFGRGADREAVQQIVQALGRDGFDVTSPSGVQALRAELQRFTGKPVSLADIGSAIRARAGVGLRSPSGAQQQSIDQVIARGQGQGQRLAADVRANVAPRTDVHALDEALVAQREAEALPLREQALFERQVIPPELPALPAPAQEAADAGLMRMLGETAPAIGPVKPMDRNLMDQLAAKAEPEIPQVPQPAQPFGPPAPQINDRVSRMVDDPVLNQLANEHPLAQRALSGAVTLSQSERALKQMLGQPLDDVPEILAGQQLDYRTVDYLKRYLDREVDNLYRRGQSDTFSAAEAGQVKALRDALRERMRSTNDEYGQYLDAYRGSSEMIDALAEGRGYRNFDPEQIAAGQADRSTAAQELYRVGAARDVLDTLNSTADGRNPATRILNSPESRAQLEATGVAPEAMTRLTNSVDQERQLNLLGAEMAGSATDARLAARADADAGVSAQLPFNPGSPFGWLGAGARAVVNRASIARNARVNEAALPRLLETDPAAIERTILELERTGQAVQAAQLRRTLRAARTARGVGAIIGSPTSLTEGN